jgi:UDP-hydrolysing UDP-N-acetyl-D-glucosamine 2-epimerase
MSGRMRVCVVTGSRAEYGLLRPVMQALATEDDFELQVVATASHLSPEFGSTVRTIEADGFAIDARVEMLLSSDTPVGIAKSVGLGTSGFADALAGLAPDLLLILGDRFELLSVVSAALPARIPIAHISGGDVTEGAIDDAIRHAVTKLSHLHFVTNEPARRRVLQMGEPPSRVVLSGNPALDELARFEPVDRDRLFRELGLPPRDHLVLVTYHPVTLAEEDPQVAFGELLAALEELGDDHGTVITLPNADTGGRVLIGMAERAAEERDDVVAATSLGQRQYWNCLHHADTVVGNSSSALIEAPVLGVRAVDVGERQRGRLRADSLVHVRPDRQEIADAVRLAVAKGRAPKESPYGGGHAVELIIEALRGVGDASTLLHKPFHEVDRRAQP